jgi:hypothetical protein
MGGASLGLVAFAPCAIVEAVTHDEARVLLARYATGELDMAPAAAVRAHVAAGCSPCLQELFRRPIARRHVQPRLEESGAEPSVEGPRTTPSVEGPPVSQSIETAPAHASIERPISQAPTRRSLAVVASMLVLAVAGAWATHELRVRQARFAVESARLNRRLSKADADRAALSGRLARAMHALQKDREERDGDDATDRETNAEPWTESEADLDGAPSEPVETSPAAQGIRYVHDTLTVHLAGVPVADVLQEIARQSGATVRGRLSISKNVTADFDDLPFALALRQLLSEQNFLVVYEEHRPRTIDLLSAADTSASAGVAAVSPPEPSRPPDPAPSLASTLALLDQHPAVALSGELAQVLGTQRMSLRQLIDTSLHHGDKRVRSGAMRAALDAIQSDPTLGSELLDAFARTDSTVLAELVSGVAGDRAQEVLFYVATQARGGELRSKAVSLLQRLGVEPSG